MTGKEKKKSKDELLQERLEAYDVKFKELDEVINTQKETIKGLQEQQVQLEQDAKQAKVCPSNRF